MLVDLRAMWRVRWEEEEGEGEGGGEGRGSCRHGRHGGGGHAGLCLQSEHVHAFEEFLLRDESVPVRIKLLEEVDHAGPDGEGDSVAGWTRGGGMETRQCATARLGRLQSQTQAHVDFRRRHRHVCRQKCRR